MLFDRYGEILERLEDLGARVGELNNRDRQLMQNLLDEQEWLAATLVKRARFLLEEIDRSFEKLFDWMISFSDVIDRAAGPGGTPADVLRMERIMQEAEDLRERLNNLVPEHGPGVSRVFRIQDRPFDPPGELEAVFSEPGGSADRVTGVRREAAPAAAEAVEQGEIVPPAGPVFTLAGKARPPVAAPPAGKKAGSGEYPSQKPGGGTKGYVPPRELVAELEKKMAAASIKPKTGHTLLAFEPRME